MIYLPAGGVRLVRCVGTRRETSPPIVPLPAPHWTGSRTTASLQHPGDSYPARLHAGTETAEAAPDSRSDSARSDPNPAGRGATTRLRHSRSSAFPMYLP